ncbi:MAG: PEP-CTERM sorting domain-containing protein [Bryobacterales bacterium]|nr:PEP-CTERM sorting domain-containing protein [Bryobacterales bacterium]
MYGDSIIGSGFDGVRSLRTEPGGWELVFSQPVSAAGFVTTFSHAPSSDGVIRSLLYLTVGSLPMYVIDPAGYGMPRNASITAFIGFVDLTSPHASIAFEHLDEMFSNRFNTDLFTAATPDQVVPEPSTWAAMAAGLGAVAWKRRRRARP